MEVDASSQGMLSIMPCVLRTLAPISSTLEEKARVPTVNRFQAMKNFEGSYRS
jgi:hypothetical protein